MKNNKANAKINETTRTHRANVRLNDTEYKILQDAKKKYNLPTSTLLRTLIYFYKNQRLGFKAMQNLMEYSTPIEKNTARLFDACSKVVTQSNSNNAIVRGLANNFNQLVRRVNAGQVNLSRKDILAINNANRIVKDYYLADRAERAKFIDVINELRKEAE